MSALLSSSSSSPSSPLQATTTTTTSAAAQQLLTSLPPAPSCLPAFTLDYFHVAARAYNMTRYLINTLKLDDTVFATAMCYWHEFATRLGHRRVNAVVLAAACVFLAGKVEHYKLRVDQIVALVFEVQTSKRVVAGGSGGNNNNNNNNNSNSHDGHDDDDEEAMAAGWRRMVLEVELVLSDALQFDFQRTHACQAMLALLASPVDAGSYATAASGGGGDGNAAHKPLPDVVAELQAIATRFYVLSLITPLYATLPASSVLYTLAYMTATYSPYARLYAHVWRSSAGSSSVSSSVSSAAAALPPPSSVERACVMSVVLDAFALMGKRTGLTVLDEFVSARRRNVTRS